MILSASGFIKKLFRILVLLGIFCIGFIGGYYYNANDTKRIVSDMQERIIDGSEIAKVQGYQVEDFYGKIKELNGSILWVRKIVGPDAETQDIIEVGISPRTELIAMKYQNVKDISKQFLKSDGNIGELKENIYVRVYYRVTDANSTEKVEAQTIYYSDKNPFLFQ
ncbi:hypothetical protein HY623_01360 [Candidatus Uhrbacteria bacterium]|nr:hypothetical protein [Candidatus Uhrbacteria bacterium]